MSNHRALLVTLFLLLAVEILIVVGGKSTIASGIPYLPLLLLWENVVIGVNWDRALSERIIENLSLVCITLVVHGAIALSMYGAIRSIRRPRDCRR